MSLKDFYELEKKIEMEAMAIEEMYQEELELIDLNDELLAYMTVEEILLEDLFL